MAVDALQIEVFQAVQLRRGLMSLAEGAAQPRHAGVDLQLHVETSTALGSQSVAELGIPKAAQGGHQPPVQAGAQVLRFIEVAEQQHWCFQPGPPQLKAFLQRGYAKAGGSPLKGCLLYTSPSPRD